MKMINDLINTIRNLEAAFFFIIPVMLVLAIFSRKIFKNNASVYFLLTAGFVVFGIRILLVFTVNKLVGRYYMPVVLVWTCFAAAGIYCVAISIQYLLKRFKQKVNLNLIAGIIMTGVLIGSSAKAFRFSRKEFLNKFAVCLKPFDSSDTLLLTMTGTGRRINKRLSGKIQVQGVAHEKRSLDYWLNFFKKYEQALFKYKNIFVVVKQRKKLKYPGDSFESIFRNYYMIFPFDLISKYNYKKDTYLLYRFNYKIGDGILPAPTPNDKNPLGLNLPPCFTVLGKEKKIKINIQEFISEKLDPNDFFLECNSIKYYGKVFGNNWEFKIDENKQFDFLLSIIIRNQLLFPVAMGKTSVISCNSNTNNKRTQSCKLKTTVALNAEFQPQLNMPGKIYVLPEGTRVFFSDFNVLPDAARYEAKFEFNGKTSTNNFMDISGGEGELKLIVKDKVFNTKTEAKSSIKLVSSPMSLSTPLRILLIEPNAIVFEKSDTLLKKTLKKYGVKAEIVSLCDFVSSKESFGYWNVLKKINIIKDGIKRHSEIFDFPFDIVLINCGYNDIYSASKRWLINTEAWKMRQQLKEFINYIRERFPNACIGLALPIAPAPAASYYDTGTSEKWFRKKLGHRALCKSLYNSLGNRENEKIFLVSLFHNIDPQKDYHIAIKELKAKGITYWYPMALSRAGQQKAVNSLTAWILYTKKQPPNITAP